MAIGTSEDRVKGDWENNPLTSAAGEGVKADGPTLTQPLVPAALFAPSVASAR
jgi:hypothetical protein